MASIAGIIDKSEFFGKYPEDQQAIRVIGDCRLYYREDLLRSLEPFPGGGQSTEALPEVQADDDELILEAYRKWGTDSPGRLEGDFAFVVLDPAAGRIFCARDAMGCRPLFYHNDANYFAFASSAAALLELVELNPRFDEGQLLNCFTSRLPAKDRSFFTDIRRLEPGHAMEIRQPDTLVFWPWWELREDPGVKELGDHEVLPRFTELLEGAIRERIRGADSIGVELSGGLDSSALAAGAKRLRPELSNLHAFCHSLPDHMKERVFPFQDESKWSRKVSSYLGLDSLSLVDGSAGRPVLELCRWHIALTAQPLTQLFPLFSDTLLAEAGKMGVDVMLSGFGGDEAVSYRLREKGGRARQLNRFATFFGLRPRVGSYQARDLAVVPLLRKQVMELERERRREISPIPAGASQQQKRRLGMRHLADRMEQSCLLARSHGLDYVYPLLDARLVRFVYSLGEKWLRRNGEDRYLLRAALEGLLPDEIRLRKDKFGAALPNIYARICMDQEALEAFIRQEGGQERQAYVDCHVLERQLHELCDPKKVEELAYGPRIFLSTLSLLILQDMERKGELLSGIKT